MDLTSCCMKEDAKKDSKSLLEEIRELYSKGDSSIQSGFSKYTQDGQKLGHIPSDPYSHAWGLLHNQTKKLATDGMDILDSDQVVLGNVKNDKTLAIYQKEYRYLVNLCKMALNDEIFTPVFEVLWKQFVVDIRLTGVMGGTERAYQAFQVPTGVSTKSGFGGTFLRKKKPREPIEYLIPSEEEEGVY